MTKPIPKRLHLFWGGSKPLPDMAKASILEAKSDGWQIDIWRPDDLPDIEIVAWAVENQRWSIASEVCRHYAIASLGGLYIDTDIEWMRDPYPVISNYDWFVTGEQPRFGNAAVSGGNQFNPMSLEFYSLLRDYDYKAVSKLPLEVAVGPHLLTNQLADRYGIILNPTIGKSTYEFSIQSRNYAVLNELEFFGGGYIQYHQLKMPPYKKGYLIHHWAKTW